MQAKFPHCFVTACDDLVHVTCSPNASRMGLPYVTMQHACKHCGPAGRHARPPQRLFKPVTVLQSDCSSCMRINNRTVACHSTIRMGCWEVVKSSGQPTTALPAACLICWCRPNLSTYQAHIQYHVCTTCRAGKGRSPCTPWTPSCRCPCHVCHVWHVI